MHLTPMYLPCISQEACPSLEELSLHGARLSDETFAELVRGQADRTSTISPLISLDLP